MRARPTSRRWLILPPSVALAALVALIACSEEPVRPSPEASSPLAQQPQPSGVSAALVSARVQVPAGMRSAPFDVPRYLNIPSGFAISVYARISNARFLAVTPDGRLLVSRPAAGKVSLVRPNGSGNPIVSDFVTGLRRPHDLVFHTISGTTYLYVTEAHQINRYVYRTGDLTGRGRQIVVTGLPYQGRPGLKYNHELKNIALDGSHNLYVMLASSCDACVEDTRSNPKRGAIYRYTATGGSRRLFAEGLRNAEGLAFVPGTNDLWVVVNQQNAIRHPQTGELSQSYIDNHPPEEFTRVRQGGNYGWPFCNPNPDTPSGYNNMPFDRDYENNRDGHVNCEAMDRINKGL